jgi:hypothetical protein
VMFVSAQVMDGPKSQLYEVDLPDELVGCCSAALTSPGTTAGELTAGRS